MVSTVEAAEKAVLHGDTRIKCPSNVKIVRIFTSSTFTGTFIKLNSYIRPFTL